MLKIGFLDVKKYLVLIRTLIKTLIGILIIEWVLSYLKENKHIGLIFYIVDYLSKHKNLDGNDGFRKRSNTHSCAKRHVTLDNHEMGSCPNYR